MAHHLAKAAHKSGWESEAGHCPWKPHGGRRHGGKHLGGVPGWLETLASYLNEWTNLPGEEEPQVKEDSTGPSSSKQQKAQEQQEDARVQYLRNIGQTVASVLDPLGEKELNNSFHSTLVCYFLLVYDIKFSFIMIE